MKENNQKELKQKKKERLKPISLYPLKPEEALKELFGIKSLKEEKLVDNKKAKQGLGNGR